MNLAKVDPTKTTALRRRFRTEIRKRFAALIRDVKKFIIDDDAFGLEEGHPFQPLAVNAERQQFRFQTDPQKVTAFRQWLSQRVNQGVLTTDAMGKPWTAEYVGSAYRQGLVKAYLDMHKEDLSPNKDYFRGGKEQFLRDAFAAPEVTAKLQAIYTRSYDALEGITQDMGRVLGRILADGLANGEGPHSIAKGITDSISGIERSRAERIARTETIFAHAEGALDGFSKLGLDEVGLEAEWSTAGDDRVCFECNRMAGKVFKIAEAHGMIPLHPNCRCTWLPINDTLAEIERWRGERE